MGTLADKLAYLNDTKSAIRTAVAAESITDDTPFRDYASVITDKLNNIVYQMVIGNAVSITDAINARFDTIKIFGKSTQSGTPTPANPVEIVSLDTAAATFAINDTALALPDIGDFRGVPVASDGTYTDANGQRYICDYIDITAKQYVQQIGKKTVDGSGTWGSSSVNAAVYYTRFLSGDELSPSPYVLCNSYACDTSDTASMSDKSIKLQFPTSGGTWVYICDSSYSAVSDFKTALNNSPIDVFYVLSEPIITPLTDEQIEAFAQLYTSTSGTAISNSMGADMQVIYLKR